MTTHNESQSLHIALNEIQHLRKELTEKNAYINELESKLAQQQPKVESMIDESVLPLLFNGNWYTSAKAELQAYIRPKTGKPLTGQKKILAEFKKAIAECETNESIDDVWKCIIKYVESFTVKTNVKHKKASNIATCIRLLNIPKNNEFECIVKKWKAEIEASAVCRVMSIDELAFLKMNDGRYLTTVVLQELCHSIDDPYKRMALSTVAYHGNRWQDWSGIKYGQSNFDNENDRGYYCVESHTLMLYTGKTHNTQLVERAFEIHPEVAKAIETYHQSVESVWLIPHCTAKSAIKCDKSITADAMNSRLQEWFFDGQSYPKITINSTRHMYETHIRYVAQLSDEELKNEWKAIAHSEETARKCYAELYKLTAM